MNPNQRLSTGRLAAGSWRAVLLLCLAVASAHAAAAPEISAADARRDLRILKRAFTDLHPALYRQVPPERIEAEFAAADAALAEGSTRGQMFLLASRLAAAVGCGHTWTNGVNQSPVVQQQLFARADKLPLTMRRVAGRFLVTGSAVPASVPAGAELLAIDGRPVAGIVAALLPYLRADGAPGDQSGTGNGKRLSQLDHGPNGGAMDRLVPLLFAPTAGAEGLRWRLQWRTGAGSVQEAEVPAMTAAERDLVIAAPVASNDWRLNIDGDTAVLTLPTFSFWRGGFDARAFIVGAFDTLAAQRVTYLVIDNRTNEGGDDALGQALLARLIAQPFTTAGVRRESAYERVPYLLARYLDTWDFGFFDRTGQVTRGPGRNWVMPDSPPQTVAAVAPRYTGRVLLLVGPQNSSAGYLFARDMQASGAATLLGRPTSGNRQGLNGGQLAWLTLPASGVAVDIPLVANFVMGNPAAGGVVPDVLVPENFDDTSTGIDTEMQSALALIERWRREATAR